jgi:hypothetical protein
MEEPASEEIPSDQDQPAVAAQRVRRELWEYHARLGRTAHHDLDSETLAELFVLTDKVLVCEDLAEEHREQEDYSRSSRRVYMATAALVIVAVAVLVVGIVLGWLSGWGIAAVSITGVAGLVMAGAHALAEPAGHDKRALIVVVSLILGVTVVALAPSWLPGWVAVIAVALLVGSTAAFVATVSVEPLDDEE